MEKQRHIADELKYVCNTYEGRKGPWFSAEAVWESGYADQVRSCQLDLELDLEEYVLTDREQEALDVGGSDRMTSLEMYYAMCARPVMVSRYQGGNSFQAREVAGALTLCPNHPEATEAREFIDKHL